MAERRVCRVSGWGFTSPSSGQIPSTLRTVTLPIVSAQKCNSSRSFNGSITENMLCAGYSTGGKDACKVRGIPLLNAAERALWLHKGQILSAAAHKRVQHCKQDNYNTH